MDEETISEINATMRLATRIMVCVLIGIAGGILFGCYVLVGALK